ncbi:MAG: hypothetical protein ACYCO3_08760 [Mycobacteriales bacterium]
MRWDDLFRDLEGQWSALEEAEFAAEVADRTRRELARLLLADRLRAQLGRPVGLSVLGVGSLAGQLIEAGPDWLRLSSGTIDYLVPLAAATSFTGLSLRGAASGSVGVVAARLDLRYALRGLARARLPVSVQLTDGAHRHGTFDRVGADFVDLAEHAPEDARRQLAVRASVTIPLAALALVRPA